MGLWQNCSEPLGCVCVLILKIVMIRIAEDFVRIECDEVYNVPKAMLHKC